MKRGWAVDMKGDETRDRIKLAALKLFAERGVDGVSIREIVSEAGQRNVGSLHYYFRTKEALVRELVIDGAKVINDRRNEMLARLHRDGGPTTLREVIEMLVWPSIGGSDIREQDGTYMRFVASLSMNHREIITRALQGGEWDSGYRECLKHIRELLPHIPERVLDQRIVFMGIYLGATIASRASAVDAGGKARDFWMIKSTMDNFIDTIQALLEAPVEGEAGFHRQEHARPGELSEIRAPIELRNQAARA
ncbi:MAG: helix-turn-helix domain-containing protein [Parvibaculum sp.]|uniref:TetR/AcrR family transcriptional regulator n=1 Tax=Parvibaculum sp. TaxID=2024848 RepID=UPI003C730A83